MQNRATNAFARLKSLAFKQPSFGQVFYKYLELTQITSQGELVFTLKLTQEHCDYSGRFHTGAISALLDGSTTLSA